ncbi:nucleotide-diphosphate-sugar epimerase [Streptomyces antimycoticus]|uniref:Nucleotide-diphosphate-sugar epimerase n=1 Tax=Streptomyces antimycoticus TaxID=68175 RepID=A0A499UIV3_9ACTN|nr:NAD(P)H-binding protein [Streptomyces antimycoticus]BBJ41614.1 nucleotide-diphosphate-sugar epimerase [Streptomyces antimycoticus]
MFVVTGATGNVGGYVVKELADAGAEVLALTRDPEAARLPQGVRAARTEEMPLDGATALFLNPAVVWQVGSEKILERAKESGVRRIVMLSSSSVLQDLDPHTNPIGVRHRALEDEVEATGLEWTFVRPGGFAANSLQWVDQIKAGDVVYGPYAGAQMAAIHEADMGAVAARALLADDLVGQTPELTGPESLSFADQVRIIGEVVGRPLRYEEIPPEAARERMVGDFLTPEMADSLLRVFAELVDRPQAVSPEVERITGRPGRTFAQWVEDHVADFR